MDHHSRTHGQQPFDHDAISGRDYFLVQGCILSIGLTYVGVNFLTDVLYSVANPRIRQ